jgi:hypothetical protein
MGQEDVTYLTLDRLLVKLTVPPIHRRDRSLMIESPTSFEERQVTRPLKSDVAIFSAGSTMKSRDRAFRLWP